MYGHIVKAIKDHSFPLDHHLRKEMYTTVDETADPNKPLQSIDDAQCYALDESFHSSYYDYSKDSITLYFSSTGSPEGAKYATIVRSVNRIKLLKDRYCMVVLDRRHWHLFVGTTED